MSSQSDFRAGLLDPSAPAPLGLQDATSGPSGKRYDVYRNNVTHSLIEALTTAFPLVHKLIGPRRFAEVAVEFVRVHPPSSPLMMFYGVEFPEFLAKAPVLSDIGYLPDAARLDLAMRRSYHAADAEPFDAVKLQGLGPEALMKTRFSPAPSTQILRSPWPLFDIWRFSFEEGAPKPRAEAQDVLITRPNYDPMPHLLPSGGAIWFNALAAGQDFGQATETAQQQTPDFDLETTLTIALTSEGLTDPTIRN